VSRAIDRSEAEVRAALPWVFGVSLAFTVALVLAEALALALPLARPYGAGQIAMLFAIAWDLRTEWRARGELGELVAVWPIQQVYAVDPALAALQAAGIDARARGLRFRQLLQFFAPYAPIEVLVPPHQAEEAGRLLGQRAR
jgi:hypothetical protein